MVRSIVVQRDVSADMREAIEQELQRSGPSWIAAAVAASLVERLSEEDPELLSKWLEQQAVRVVREAIVGLEGARRMRARTIAERRTSSRSVFAGALTRYEETGEPEVLAAWLDTTFVVTVGNQRKALGDMDRDDLYFAADRYTTSARSLAMQAAFLRVLADRVGARQVREVFDEAELNRVWREISS